MYPCSNASKCISNHRLLDGIQDCPRNDDETFNDTCSLNQTHRFQCSITKNKCFSPLLIQDDYCDCPNCEDEIFSPSKNNVKEVHIPFYLICDGFQDITSILIDGRYETDETEFNEWQCNNYYTSCNNIWNCPNGIDEINCSNLTSHRIDRICITSDSYDKSCSLLNAKEGSNCSALIKPPEKCVNISFLNPSEFNSWTNNRYLSVSLVCNLITGCITNDKHELTTMGQSLFECTSRNNNQIQEVSCSLSTLYKYSYEPKIDRSRHALTYTLPEKKNIYYIDSKKIWHCHRGLPI